MRALTFDGRSVQLDRRWEPAAPAAGDVVLKVRRVAVGPVDAAILRGAAEFTGVLGHELIGEVIEATDPKHRSFIGKRAVVHPVIWCGECAMCQGGLAAHCRARTIIGLHGRDGALAEQLMVPARNLVTVSDRIDDDHAVFAIAVSRALQAVRQLRIEGKPYITILGDGALALITAQFMAKLNASVRVVGWLSEHLALCEKWGIKHRHADDIGRREDQDIVVDCSSTARGFALALRLVRPRGTIVMKSRIEPAAWRAVEDLDLSRIVRNELVVMGSDFGPLAEAVESIAREEIDVVSLISRRMKLDDGEAIMRQAARPETLRVLVDC